METRRHLCGGMPEVRGGDRIFKDDTRRRGAWCATFDNPRSNSAAPPRQTPKKRPRPGQGEESGRDLQGTAAEQVKNYLKDNAAAWEATETAVHYAQDLLKAEGGDPKVVLAATLLHRVEPDQARDFLAELETEPELVAAILELIRGGAAAKDLNRQLYQDALHLLSTNPDTTFHTRTARRLAAEGKK